MLVEEERVFCTSIYISEIFYGGLFDLTLPWLLASMDFNKE